MIGIMMPRIIRTRDRISKSLIHIALLYESVKRGLFKKEVTLTFMRAEPSTVMAAPEPHIAVRFYSTRNRLVWQVSIHAKTGNIAAFCAWQNFKTDLYWKYKECCRWTVSPQYYSKKWADDFGKYGRLISFLCRWGFEQSILRSWWLKIRFQNHSWYHPSLRVGLRDFSYSRNVPHTVRKIRIWGPNRPPFYGSTRTAYCSSFLFYQKSSFLARFLFDAHGHQFAVERVCYPQQCPELYHVLFLLHECNLRPRNSGGRS